MFIIVEFQIFLKNARNLRKLRFFFENCPNFPEERSYFGEWRQSISWLITKYAYAPGQETFVFSQKIGSISPSKLPSFFKTYNVTPPENCPKISKRWSIFREKLPEFIQKINKNTNKNIILIFLLIRCTIG